MSTIYSWVRTTHLVCGLLGAAFLLMYGVSAFQMSHPGAFTMAPRLTESDVAVGENATSPRVLGRFLMVAHGMHGELGSISQQPAGFTFQIVRPGTVHSVTYRSGASSAHVRTSVAGVMGMLNRLHHIGGLGHEYWLLNVWGAFVALISVLLLALGLTGVWLWFETYDERRIGGAIFGLGLGIGLGLAILTRLQP